MLRISQLKLPVGHDEQALHDKIRKTLRFSKDVSFTYEIRKQSMDARKKPELWFVYTVDVKTKQETAVLKKAKCKDVSLVHEKPYEFPTGGTEAQKTPPIVVGMGPAGLFCAYMLALAGYQPILLERGKDVDRRMEDVEAFWETGILDPDSNVQFGEGGAGTFSDGKLNTLVKDPIGRNRKVLEIFVENGAPKDILYVNKPHIGTDILMTVVKNMRQRILAHGGIVHFESQVTGLVTKGNRLTGLLVEQKENGKKNVTEFPADTAVFAIGHSARDTFEMLLEQKLSMEAKSFAVGVRVEHEQTFINESQYGAKAQPHLGAAAYKVTANLENGRGVYSFCMCPGGYVVNASSEEGHLAVNGMSYHDRAGENANSAIIVTVTPKDYGQEGPLSGVHFQRQLERAAFLVAGGKIPVQLFGDFKAKTCSTSFGKVRPQMKGAYAFGDVRSCFPKEIGDSLVEGIEKLNEKIHGFSNADTILSGVESRTSSPVRILRDETLNSNICGLYPCGEGAGYAGGITSAAMDGLKVAEKIAEKYRKPDAGNRAFRKI